MIESCRKGPGFEYHSYNHKQIFPDLGFGIWDLGFGIWDSGFGIWDSGFGIEVLGLGT